MADAIGEFDGSGIIYGLTIDGVHALAAFLREGGHEVETYGARRHPDIRRKDRGRDCARTTSRQSLRPPPWAWATTKPDLAFCLHVGSAQLTGRLLPTGGTGRASAESAVGVLLRPRNPTSAFGTTFTATLPDPQEAQRVLTLLAERPMSTATRVAAEPAAQPRGDPAQATAC